jgi:hypothetical protein
MRYACGTQVCHKGGQPLHKHKHAPPGERKPKPKVPKQKPPRPPQPKHQPGRLESSSSSASSTSDQEELRSASKASKPSADASPRSSTPLVETPVERSTRQLRKTRKKLREISRLSGKGRSQLDVQQQQKLDRRQVRGSGAPPRGRACRRSGRQQQRSGRRGGGNQSREAPRRCCRRQQQWQLARRLACLVARLHVLRTVYRPGRERHRDDRKLVAMAPSRTSTGQIALYMHSRVYRKVGEAVMITSEKK